MLLPLRWLKEYVDIGTDYKSLSEQITLSGSHVDSIDYIGEKVDNVITVRIEKIDKHPNKDRLFVCKTYDGINFYTIVTAAKNLKEQDIVPQAKVGAILGDKIIQAHDFDGVISEGMLCSINEIGYSTSVTSKNLQEGILILDEKTSLGIDIKEALSMSMPVFDLEITPNRPDCLSVLGMAREVKATLNSVMREPDYSESVEGDEIKSYLEKVEIKSEDCLRYYSRALKNVKIGPSPLYLQQRLMEAGIRPINNVVDITNYVMLELGEPLHAFDAAKIKSKVISVENSDTDFSYITLDEVERKILKGDLLIKDKNEVLALAGIMGGMDSSISENTECVILEGACFNKSRVRYTSKRLGLRTEASNRFEKGISPYMAKLAVDRAVYLIEKLGAADAVSGFYDIKNFKKEQEKLITRPSYINKLLGTNIENSEMIDYLNRLDIESELIDNKIVSKIPYYRTDIEIEADIAEEVGRLYGFHNIASQAMQGAVYIGSYDYERKIDDKVREFMIGKSFDEILTYSFISPKNYDMMCIDKDDTRREYIKILNPLGEDFSAMRSSLAPGMLKTMALNINNNAQDIRLFELGNIFKNRKGYISERNLSIGICGEYDFYSLKSIVKSLMKYLGIENLIEKRLVDDPLFHKGRALKLSAGSKTLADIGQINYDVLDSYSIKGIIYFANIDMQSIYELYNPERKYKKINKYPIIKRDLAFVVNKNIDFGDIRDEIFNINKEYIKSVSLFDIYENEKIGSDNKSIAFTVKYQATEKTLSDQEIEPIENTIIKNLKERFKAELRS